MVELSEEEIRVEMEGWAASAVVPRSLDQRVVVEAVIKEFGQQAALKGEVVVYNMEQGHLMVRFMEAGERDLILGRSWVVAGQALAVEPWWPRFCSSEGAICSALVWVRLPRLLVELWGKVAIRRILCRAGEMKMGDDCTAEQRRIGFSRVYVRLDLSRPLRPEC